MVATEVKNYSCISVSEVVCQKARFRNLSLLQKKDVAKIFFSVLVGVNLESSLILAILKIHLT